MKREQFDPANPAYKTVADLPEKKREKFVDIPAEEGSGFATREARQPILEAQIEAIVKKDPTALTKKLEALEVEGRAWENDRSAYLRLLKSLQPEDSLGDPPKAFRADREIMLAAVIREPEVLLCAAPELRADRKFVLAAAQKEGTVLFCMLHQNSALTVRSCL